MKRPPDNPNKQQVEPIRFGDAHTSQEVLKNGIVVVAFIKTCREEPNPSDTEHTVFSLEYEYKVAANVFKRELTFSINTMHINYGYKGGLFNTPKFKYSLDDFRNAMQPGQKLQIRTLTQPPYSFLVEVNEVMSDIMRHDAVWR